MIFISLKFLDSQVMTIRLSDCEFSMYVCYIHTYNTWMYIHSTYVGEIIEKNS